MICAPCKAGKHCGTRDCTCQHRVPAPAVPDGMDCVVTAQGHFWHLRPSGHHGRSLCGIRSRLLIVATLEKAQGLDLKKCERCTGYKGTGIYHQNTGVSE